MHAHAFAFQCQLRLSGNLFRQAAQDARPGFDQGDIQPEALLAPEASLEHIVGFEQFGRQLHPGGPRADDGDREAAPLGERSAGEGSEQALVEVLGIARVFEHLRMLGRTGRAEEVGAAAHRQHRMAEADAALGHDRAAVVVVNRCEGEALPDRVQGSEIAQGEAEMIARRQGRVRQPFLVRIQRAGGHFVQRRLPDVEHRAIHQQHLFRPAATAQLASEARCQFQPAGTAADDHDFVVHCTPLRLIGRYRARPLLRRTGRRRKSYPPRPRPTRQGSVTRAAPGLSV